jgi:glucose/arabinose dehydrogenase
MNGQSLTTLHAKILRIDVDHPSGGHAYGIPSSNPFAGGGGAPEAFVRGLRNPWRFSIDGNGDLYIGDVGQGSREEVDYVAAGSNGQNFGWSVWEGVECVSPPCANPLDQPIVDYDRVGNGRCSVIGGYVYRGNCIPDLTGTYLYGDYCAGEFYSFRQVGGEATEQAEITANLDPDGVAYAHLVSFGQDGFGELYVVTSAPNNTGSAIYRIEAE